MMDLFSMLKMANIFSPSGQMNQQQFPVNSIGGPTDSSSSPPQIDLMSQIQGMLNPRDEQFQNFADMIKQMPQQKDYEPGKFRKIAAAIAGMGAGGPVGIANGQVVGYKSDVPKGLEIQRSIEDEPYYKALSNWSRQLDPTEKIAQMESTRNTNLRQIGLGTLQKQQNQEKIDETERENKARDIDRSTRANAYAQAKLWAEQHPNYEGRTDKNGNLYYVNKTDPTDIKETGIDTGKLGDLEKSDLNIKGRLEEITAQGAQARQTTALRQSQGLANAKELENVRQLNRVGLKETPAPARPGVVKPLSPTQQKQDTINKALQVISANPELKPYIKFEKNNAGTVTGVTIPPNGDRWFADLRGFKESDRMRAYNSIFSSTPNQTNKSQLIDRNKAIDALRAAKIPVTEDNIKKAMDPSNWK